MKQKANILLALALCAFLPCIAMADDEDNGKKEQEDTIEVFGMKLPKTQPTSAGNLSKEDAEEKYGKFVDLRAKILDCYEELDEITKLEDPKKIKRKAQGALRKLERAKKTFYKEAKKLTAKIEKPYKQLKHKIASVEKQLENAEKKEDAKKTAKFKREIEKLNAKFDKLDDAMNYIIFNCFFEEDEALAEALDMDIPGHIKAGEDDGEKEDKPKDKKKKNKKDDNDDDDDEDKPKKKKKKSKKKRD